ncbi:unnamed protein product [Clonostachys solani]|uniref:F-box domain-containing protein n=1 Tax=Clonostachys solani TaxID=160281 RepID=A0A9N9Z8H6_9HYPO|nr:unnamed protein product [Clonostachys solani]
MHLQDTRISKRQNRLQTARCTVMADAILAGQFCSLCGGPQNIYTEPLEEVRWTDFVHSVRRRDGVVGGGSPTLMRAWGVAVDDDQADDDDDDDYDYEAGDDVPFPAVLIPIGRRTSFDCHRACWHLLLLQIASISQHPPDPTRIESLVVDILDSTPWGRDSHIIPENDYCGATSMRQSEEGRQLLCADPDEPFPPNADSTFSLEELGIAMASNLRVRPSGPLSHTDPFYKLPDEIVQDILLHLPSEDLCSARLASRRVAILGAIDNLPQSFWTSRFASDRDMGCLYGVTIPTWVSTDWFRGYFCCKWHLRHVAGADGFRNRRRIWRCLSDLSVIISRLLNSGGDKQLDTSALSSNQGLTQQASSPELPAFRIPNPKQPIQLGVMLHNEHKLLFRGEGDDHRVEIEFSSIVLSSTEFISGCRVSVQHSDDLPRDVQQAGLIITSTLTSIFLGPGDKISYIDVYISTSGIHCLEFFIAKSDGEIHMHTVGKLRRRYGVIAIKRLVPESTIVGLKFRFDMYKAVTIQLIEDTKQNMKVGPVALWNPPIPPDGNQDLTALPIPTPHERAIFPVNLYMPFGGPDGSRLSSLHSITAFVHGTAGIYGLRFTYSEGEPVLYGHQEFMEPDGRLVSCVEQTLLVDGENGERVVQFAPGGKLGRHNFVENIVARTNFNHLYIFGPFDGSEIKCDEVLTSEQGAIFAVVASISAPDWKFESLQSQSFLAPCPPRSLFAAPYTTSLQNAGPAPANAPWMNQEEGSCFTTASLQGIRRIRMSMGTDNRCRSASHMSGLWIEYYGDRRDVIVGQWIQESARVLLQPDERIIDLTIWSTMEVTFQFPVQKLGKISGIELGTTRNRVVRTQMPPNRGARTYVRYTATPFEDITSIIWGFNSRMDDVQVRLDPNQLLAQKTLAFGHSERHPRPFDLSDGRSRSYFEFLSSDFAAGSFRFRELSMRYHFPRNTYFFEDVNSRGQPVRLTEVQISPDVDGNIAGLAFHYDDGKIVKQGRFGYSSISLHLDHGRDERISLLLVYQVAAGKRGLEILTGKQFRSNLGQTIRIVPENQHVDSLAVFALDPAVQCPDPSSFEQDFDKVIINEFPSVDGNQEPIESCVGIWTVSRYRYHEPRLQFEDVGPIFISRSN